MTGNTAQHAEAIPRLVEEQLRLCQQLDGLSERQHGLIDREDTDALLGVLRERQALIDRIAEVSGRLGPYRASWESHVSALGDEDRAGVRAMLDALETTMRRVAERDEADRLCMENRRAAIRQQASGVSRSGAAMTAYGSAPVKGPRYQDRRA